MASLTTPSTSSLERRGLRHHLGAQLGVGAGQVLAGLGNLAFSMVAARLLAPGAFATLTAFLALSLLVAVPAGSLAAGSILSSDLHDRASRRPPLPPWPSHGARCRPGRPSTPDASPPPPGPAASRRS